MATLWSIVTGNSALAVEAGTTFWDHLNNPKTGTGTVIIGGIKTANIQQSLSANIGNALSVNIKQEKLTVDKQVSLSASINQKLEAEIWQ